VIERYGRSIGHGDRRCTFTDRTNELKTSRRAAGFLRMRLVALNTLTVGATVVLLAVLALPAKRTLERGAEAEAAAAAAAAPLPRYEPAADPRRLRRSVACRRVVASDRRRAPGDRQVRVLLAPPDA
jgi:hypothetical protein